MPQVAASGTPFGHVDGTYVVVVAVVEVAVTVVVVPLAVVVVVVVALLVDTVLRDTLVLVFVVDVAVVDVVVTVDVQSSPHITGQFVLAKSPCSPFSTQSDFGIRDPQPADSVIPWHF